MAGREQLQGGEEGKRNALVSAIARFWVFRRLSQPAVRERFKPERLGTPGRNRPRWVPHRRGCGRQGARQAFLERIEAGVGRNRVEPGAQRSRALEREGVKVPPGTQHGFLHRILGIVQ